MKALIAAIGIVMVTPWMAQANGPQEVTVQARETDRRIACYRELHVPAQYDVEEVLVTPAVQYYFRRANGIVELRETPAIYEERRTLVREARILLREVACASR